MMLEAKAPVLSVEGEMVFGRYVGEREIPNFLVHEISRSIGKK